MLNFSSLLRDILADKTAKLRIGFFNTVLTLLALAFAMMLSLIGCLFLLAGIYQSLHSMLPAWQAGAIISVGVSSIAILILLWERHRIKVWGNNPQKKYQHQATQASDELQQAVEHGIQVSKILSRRHASTIDLALAAFIAGLIVSRNSRSLPTSPQNKKQTKGHR